MAADERIAGETTDPNGARVVLPQSVWAGKILVDHPEVAQHLSAVLRAVTTPDHVAPDPQNPNRTRYYARGVGLSRWLLVVVSYERAPARIVTAFANRKDPRSWSA